MNLIFYRSGFTAFLTFFFIDIGTFLALLIIGVTSFFNSKLHFYGIPLIFQKRPYLFL